jgi:peptidoglycan/LPS O-acetylase OafA/YrhL
MGALTEHHRCPRGPVHRLADALSTVAVGGIIGMFVLYALDEHAVPALWVAAAALGAVLTSAVRQAVNGRR